MFEAQYLFNSETVYSPWFPRRGDNVLLTLDLIRPPASGKLTVQLFTKDTEDAGTGTTPTSEERQRLTPAPPVGRPSSGSPRSRLGFSNCAATNSRGTVALLATACSSECSRPSGSTP